MQIISNKSNMLGEYYTPIELARFIVSIAFQELFRQIITTHSSKNIDNYKNWWKNPKSEYGNPLDEEEFKLIENAKILDLGIGNGIFLLNAARFFETITPNTEQQDLIKKRSDILKKNLFGVDYKQYSVFKSREKLMGWILSQNRSLKKKDLSKIENIIKHKIKMGNILLGDVFCNDSIRNLGLSKKERKLFQEKRPFHWYKEFPAVFNHNRAGFDLILCNPPYVTKTISKNDIYLYRRIYGHDLFVNRFNLYHLFLVRVKDLLSNKGIAVFLTANSLLTDHFSLRARKYLFANFEVVQIIDFLNRRLFPNILQGICALVLINKSKKNIKQRTRIVRTFNMDSLKNDHFIRGSKDLSELLYFHKIIPTPYSLTKRILNHLKENCILLKEITKIQSGEIRPADKNIRPYYFKRLSDKTSDLKLEIVLNGKNISPFIININESRLKARWYKRPLDKKERIYRDHHASIPRIIFQRITAREQLRRIIAAKIDRNHIKKHQRIWVENNANYFLLDQGIISKYAMPLEGLLGIFNSLLINWYFHQINLTAAIPPADLGIIPLPKINGNNDHLLNSICSQVTHMSSILQNLPTYSDIQTQLCPFCTSNSEIAILRSKLDNNIFQLYQIPKNFQIQIEKELLYYHGQFQHH